MELRFPSLVVHAAAVDDVRGGSRSLDSVIDAVSWAVSQQVVDRWELALDGRAPRDLPARIARTAGSIAVPGSGVPSVIVPPDVIISGVSLVRLLGASGERSVRARSVVIDGAECIASLSDRPTSAAEEWPSAPISRLRGGVSVVVPPIASLLELAIPAEFAAARQAMSDALRTEEEPLLSVIMRTQGSRPEATRDALLCLAAQTDGRFELILVGHDVSETAVERLIADQPQWLRDRTRVLTVEGGTRSRPLNHGLAQACGSHIAVLDDDDLVLPEWVGAFLDGAQSSPSRLLRAQAVAQPVGALEWPDGVAGYQNVGDATAYPTRYDLADHLRVNRTPFMSFAFPRAWLTLRGGADEQLEVCEDWDLGLRAAGELGVLDLPIQTAVYRRWTTGGDSYDRHDTAAWRRDMERVLEKADERTLVIGPGGARRLEELSRDGERAEELDGVYAGASWRVTASLRWARRQLRRLRGHAV